jgi:uncharacterized protein (TIGR02246 family)
VKQVLRLALTTVLMCCLAFSRTQDKKSNGVSRSEQQVMALNRAWAEAITKEDAAILNRLFADDVIVTSGSGEVRDKAQELKDLTPGSTPDPDFASTRRFTTENVRVRVYGDAAVVTGLAKWGFKYKGQNVNQERRYTHMYVKQRGRWRIVAQQISSNLYKKS